MTCSTSGGREQTGRRPGHHTTANVGVRQGLQVQSISLRLLHWLHSRQGPTSALLVARESPSLAEATPGGCALISSDTLQRCRHQLIRDTA